MKPVDRGSASTGRHCSIATGVGRQLLSSARGDKDRSVGQKFGGLNDNYSVSSAHIFPTDDSFPLKRSEWESAGNLEEKRAKNGINQDKVFCCSALH
ncbi:unnamed protein product [Linum trigynum]|uniref:Uncharacterized protein n=1 Tax=Linum trigynum TaxID=586398 RepID=A0AAV2G725_9ROSI